MLIDTHAHLNFKAFNKDLKKLIEEAVENGVEKIIIPGANIDSSSKAAKIANNFPSCYATVGIHPHHLYSISLNEVKRQLVTLINKPKVVAVGEIGLDYYQYENYPSISDIDKKNQKKLFLTQVEIAKDNNLPVIIHCRDAYGDLFDLLDKSLQGVFHCFTGNKIHLEQALALGFHIGFDGNITYPENSHLRKLVESTPLDRLLLETDSPFLSPLPHRGERNTPSNLVAVAGMVAKILNLSVEKIEEITYSNAIKLFHL